MKVVWVSSGDCDRAVVRQIVDRSTDLRVAAIDDVARTLSRGDCAVVCQFGTPTPADLFRLQGWKTRYPSIPFLLCIELSNDQLALWALRAGIWGLYVVPRDLIALRDAVKCLAEKAANQRGQRERWRSDWGGGTLVPRLSLLEKVDSYIEANLYRTIRVADMARACGVSAETLKGSIRREKSLSIRSYILRRRVMKVAQRLITTSASVGDVCQSCGLQDPASCTRYFRKAFGCTPTEYRKGAAAEGEELRSAGRGGGNGGVGTVTIMMFEYGAGASPRRFFDGACVV